MADVKTSVVIQAKVDGLASVKGLDSGLKKLGTTADTTGGKFAKFNGLLRGLGGAIAAAGIGRILGNAAEVAAGFESETLLLQQGLENVGAATGELERLQGVADELGKATLFNEEDFRQGFGLLTSFGNIGTENYEKVATAAANVAQVSGTDVSSAFMQLAKALNDPVAGLSALSRSGIQFTDQQKEMIKGMVESGDVIGAQTMILKELEAQYGGTAVAAAGGAAGVKDTFGEAMYDLNVAVGSLVNEALPPLLNFLTNMINAFTGLPGPVQAVILAIGGLAAAAVVLAPLVTAIGTIGPLFAGLLPAIAGVASAIGGFLPILAGVFSGPVGWIALLVGAGVAIYAFRDQIAEALGAVGEFFTGLGQTVMHELGVIGQLFGQLFQSIHSTFIQPVQQAFQPLIDFIGQAFQQATQAISDAFNAAQQFIINAFIQPVQQAFNNVVQSIGSAFSRVTNAITGPIQAAYNYVVGIVRNIINSVNSAISAIGRMMGMGGGGVQAAAQGAYWPGGFTPFAKGGMVTGPTLGLVGEAGPEYIVPAHKAPKFAQNILAGVRGPAAIPRFAEGGYVASNANVSIQTGPVTQMNGTNYVTTQDLSKAVQDGVNQTLNLLAGDSNVRRGIGLA